MSEMPDKCTPENKLKALERILKAITYTEEITYHGKDPLYVEFHGASPENFSLRGYAEGLDLDWVAELYDREGFAILGEGELAKDARMVAEIWLFEDPWKTIGELKKEIEDLDTKVNGDE